MKKIILKIMDMHCTACSLVIDTALEELPGVASAKTSYADQKTVVEFDQSKVKISQLLETIKQEGYSASF